LTNLSWSEYLCFVEAAQGLVVISSQNREYGLIVKAVTARFHHLCNWEKGSPKPQFTLIHYSTTPSKCLNNSSRGLECPELVAKVLKQAVYWSRTYLDKYLITSM
jgi:hypothetical protein